MPNLNHTKHVKLHVFCHRKRILHGKPTSEEKKPRERIYKNHVIFKLKLHHISLNNDRTSSGSSMIVIAINLQR